MHLENSWQQKLPNEGLQQVRDFLNQEKERQAVVYPPESLIFEAFKQTPYDLVKVVIMGQDPYHGADQAHGLSFSVQNGMPIPPSLRNIYLELKQDLGILPPQTGCLTGWARQGVLLLNATLTVRAKEPRSHYGKGWELFTDAVIRSLLQREEPVVFLLWGKSAQEKCAPIIESHLKRHVALTAAHPSPFSAHNGFFGCRHFSKTNQLLQQWGQTPIAWEKVD